MRLARVPFGPNRSDFDFIITIFRDPQRGAYYARKEEERKLPFARESARDYFQGPFQKDLIESVLNGGGDWDANIPDWYRQRVTQGYVTVAVRRLRSH